MKTYLNAVEEFRVAELNDHSKSDVQHIGEEMVLEVLEDIVELLFIAGPEPFRELLIAGKGFSVSFQKPGLSTLPKPGPCDEGQDCILACDAPGLGVAEMGVWAPP